VPILELVSDALRLRASPRCCTNAWLNVARNIVVLLIAVVACSGCAHVHAYERGRLANPRMDPGDAASVGQRHMQSVQEGAVGGDNNAVSGCGCN
jgi:hypothetical protein